MKTLILSLALALSVPAALGQMGIGGQPAAAFATSVAGCPTANTGWFICIVAPGGSTQPFLALSVAGYNGGAPFQLAAIMLPGTYVASFNNRAGNVAPLQGDYSYSQITGTPAPPTSLSGCTTYDLGGNKASPALSGCTIAYLDWLP